MRITDKVQMYSLLRSNQLGNTNPSWETVSDWLYDNTYLEVAGRLVVRYLKPKSPRFWGIRSGEKANDPRCAMNVYWGNVWDKVIPFGSEPINISPMIDTFVPVLYFCNVYESLGGLVVEYSDQIQLTWRPAMASPKRLTGTAAKCFLRSQLNENSYDDLQILFDEYPEHVVEMSILGSCYGTVPHRNAVVWEVRAY